MTTKRYGFGARHRIRTPRDFEAARSEGRRTDAGGVVVHARPNGLPTTRLGISIGRRAGGAVYRNRIKRLLREAFRLERPELRQGLDLVVSVRPHRERLVEEYREVFRRAAKA